MTMTAARQIDVIAPHFERVKWKHDGKGFTALCPAHDDHDPSLNADHDDNDGKVLLYCRSHNCSKESIMAAVSLSMADLFLPRPHRNGTGKQRQTITVDGLAADKGLPATFLQGLGLHDITGDGVGIPYYHADGTDGPVKRRTKLKAKEGSYWPKDTPLLAYGLDRLAAVQRAGYFLAVEGESDTWTARYHDVPVLGIPGAESVKVILKEHLSGVTSIYAAHETDAAGGKFGPTLLDHVRSLGWRGQVLDLILPDGIKDLNDLHKLYPDTFNDVLRVAMAAAPVVPHATDYPPQSLGDVLSTFQRWLFIPDTGSVEVTLGGIAASYLAGEAVWLLVVGPPSSGKTEPLNALQLLPNVHAVAVATEGALLSGTSKKEAAQGAKGGLLREVGDFGILVLKDFTSILSMHREARAQLLAALREIYDGSWTRHVGTDGGRTLHWQGKAGLLGGVTGAIDAHHAVMASLGERFLLYRVPETDEPSRAHRALAFAGREGEMRKELAAAVAGLFAAVNLHAGGDMTALTDEETDGLVALSTFVARARSAVERDPGPSRDITLVLGAESPTRLVKQLRMLLAGLRMIGASAARSWELVRKVALDSMPQNRRGAIEVLLNAGTELSTRTIAVRLGLPTTTVRHTLQDLAAYSVVARNEEQEGGTERWHATDWTLRTYAAATAFSPEKSEGVYSAAFSEQGGEESINTPNHTPTDLSGELAGLGRCPVCGEGAVLVDGRGQGWCEEHAASEGA